ncbi:MAG: glutathione transferase GstA [Burkholderiaceae bacterium]
MKLYYSPGACSLSPHIVLHEAGLKFDAVLVSLDSHKLKDGSNYYATNPLGYVPLLELDNGTRLAEGPAIVQYIADQAPDKKLAPPNGTLARYQLQSMLNFITAELHKPLGSLFAKDLHDDTRRATKERLAGRLQWLDGQLAGKQYAMSDSFSVADAYLFTVTNWGPMVGVDMVPYKNITAVCNRIKARPAVQAAMKAEGLLK